MPAFGTNRLNKSRNERKTHLEEELEQLGQEATRLQQVIDQYGARIPNLTYELSAAEAFATEETVATEIEEATRKELQTELAEHAELFRNGLKQNASPLVFGSRCLGSNDVCSPSNQTSAIAPQHHADESKILLRSIAEYEADIETFQGVVQRGDAQESLLQAEAMSNELQHELFDLRNSLRLEEAEGNRLSEEHREIEKEVEPIRDWIDHVDAQLVLARSENAELAASLRSVLEHRSDLEKDVSEAQPIRGTNADVSIVFWLQEHERKSVSRKAVLIEEIAAEKLRRESLASEAGKLREEAMAEERRQQRRQAESVQMTHTGLRNSQVATSSSVDTGLRPAYQVVDSARQQSRIASCGSDDDHDYWAMLHADMP